MKYKLSWEQLLSTLKLAQKSDVNFVEPADWQSQLMSKISNLKSEDEIEYEGLDGVAESLVWKLCGSSLVLSMIFQLYLSFYSNINESQILSALDLDPVSNLFF